MNTDLNSKLYPNTELGIDLKLMTHQAGRMLVGAMLDGAITRDSEDHYSFLENTSEKKKANPRNPHVYLGKRINIIRKDDGTLYPTFSHPRYTECFSFRNFCQEAAKELLIVAGLTEKEATAI